MIDIDYKSVAKGFKDENQDNANSFFTSSESCLTCFKIIPPKLDIFILKLGVGTLN